MDTDGHGSRWIRPLNPGRRSVRLRAPARRFSLSLALSLLLALFLPTPAAACRYSVRDTGFVDLGTAPYRLILTLSPEAAALADLYRQAAAGSFIDANVEFAGETGAAGMPPELTLRDATGRALPLGGGVPLPRDRAAVNALLESAVMSPRRADILRETLRAYAVIVFVESTDADANERVRNALAAAVNGVARLMPSMPKPVEVPPQIITVPVTEQGGEAVLLWGLGLEPRLDAEPRVAIVYGRGRRIGSPLEGPLITRTAVQERLVMLGQDCECDLDRAWLQGPVLPGRWDQELQQLASRLLGFDPENPLVRTEVSRIVLRGEGEGQQRQRRPTSALSLGYVEESVDALLEEPTEGVEADDSASLAPTATLSNPAPAIPAKPAEPTPAPVAATLTWALLAAVLAGGTAVGAWLLLRSTRQR